MKDLQQVAYFSLELSVFEVDHLLIRCLGTLFRASQFLSEELPIRLAHRVQELGDLPDGLNEIPSIKKVQDWYAQSFEVNSAPKSPGAVHGLGLELIRI